MFLQGDLLIRYEIKITYGPQRISFWENLGEDFELGLDISFTKN